MLKLVIADDEGKTTVVPLVRDEITIGRREGNTIRLTDRNVSRRHARLRRADDNYFVEDLQSYNGVRVNGRRIAGEIAIKAGDQIVIGDYQLGLQLEESATVPTHNVDEQNEEPTTAMITAPTVPAAPAFAPAPYPQHVAPTTPARLVMVSPPAPGAEFALSQAVTRVGRAEELGVWINHRSISREHAEITNQNGVFRIRDLRSANGVRINGHDAKESELRPGDFIELGQVRFRFVGAGEHFVFDADRTMQMDAAMPRRGNNGAPLLAVIALIGVAVVGAVAVALVGSAGSEPSTAVGPTAVAEATLIPDPPSTSPAPTVPPPAMEELGPTVEERVRASVSSCRAHLNVQSFGDALNAAEQALELEPEDQDALDCKADALVARDDASAFQEGQAAYAEGDFASAVAAYDELSEESEYREQDDIADARRAYVTALLEEADAIAGDDPERAAELASTASEIDPRAARRRVQRLRRRLAQASRQARGGRRPTRASTNARTTAAASRASESTSAAEAVPAAPPPVNRMAEAQACGMDHQCIARALQHASTAPEMQVLIETLQQLRQMPQALDQMTRFVRRFPSHPQTAQYRQILMRYGR